MSRDKQKVETGLIEQIAGQNKFAFETLYGIYHHRIYRFALKVTRNPDLADETVNDTLYAVWQSAKSFKGHSTVSTWVLGIAYRQALNALKRQMRHQREQVNLDKVSEQIDENPHNDPEKMSEIKEFKQQISQAINTLSEGHRAVVQLTAMGYSYTEISQIVDCPVNTVKTRMFHARKQLQHHVNQRKQHYTRNHEFKTSC